MKTPDTWVKDPSRDYSEGLQLLKLMEPKDNHIRFLESGLKNPTDYQKSFLLKRVAYHKNLGKTASITVESKVTAAKPVIIEKPNRVKIDDNPHVKYEDLNTEMQLKYDAAKGIGRKLVSLHEKLRVEQNKSNRSDIANELDKLEDERNKLWEEIDMYYLALPSSAKSDPDESKKIKDPGNQVPPKTKTPAPKAQAKKPATKKAKAKPAKTKK